MVSIVAFFAMIQVDKLEQSAQTLLKAEIPLKELPYQLETRIRVTKFLLHKALVMNDAAYFRVIRKEIRQQKVILDKLKLLLATEHGADSFVDQLQASLYDYWLWIDNIQGPPFDEAPMLLEATVSQTLANLHDYIDTLAIEQASAAIVSAGYVTNILLLLVIGTAVFGVFVSWIYASVTTKPLRNARRILMHIGDGNFDQDINLKGLRELRELAQAINTMQVKLRSLEDSKSEFQSLISHELKTPLASFRSGTELLRSGSTGSLTHTQNRIIEIMYKQAIQLGVTIQEMLDMQAIQTQRLVMNIQSCQLSIIIKNAVDQVQALLVEKRQRVRYLKLPEEVYVLVDAGRTQQILINLLSNSHKYCPSETRITISVECYKDYVDLLVEDEGPGIPTEFIGSVCNRFFQVPTDDNHLRGTGLGLAIAKEIAQSQRGDIKLENLEKKGLCVRLRLPLAEMSSSKVAGG